MGLVLRAVAIQAKYFTIQGGAVHVGMTACHWANGTVGQTYIEFTRKHNRVYIVVGVIGNLQALTLRRDQRQLHGILLSLTVA